MKAGRLFGLLACVSVGALTLARATDDPQLSDEILEAATAAFEEM